MSSQVPVSPDLPAHDDDFDGNQTDQGVPVGEADVDADRENAAAGADDESDESDEGFAAEGQQEMASDEGEPVGQADLEADRANGHATDDS